MLYQNVSKYGLATHLALAAALPAALAQFVSGSTLAVLILWMSLVAAIWILMEPSVLSGETISGARMRVLSRISRDPLAWFFAVAVLFALARWLNNGVRLAFDAETSIWAVAEPAVSFLPASTSEAGLFPLAIAVLMAVVIIGVKHGLGRNARIWFGIAAGAVSATGAVAAAIHAGLDMEPFRSEACAVFGAPCFYGSMYALFLPAAVACGFQAEGCGMTKSRLVFAWAVAGNSLGAYFFLPGLLGAAYLAVSALIALMSIVVLKIRSGAASAARAASMLAFGVVLAVFTSILLPSTAVQESKAAGFDVEKAFPPALADRNEALTRIAKAIWLEHPWSGAGAGAFVLQAPFSAGKDDWTVLPPEPSIGPDGYLTLIAERGIAGALICLIGLGFLLQFWIARLIGSFAHQKLQDEGRSWFLNTPVVVWAGPLVLLAFLADAWFSSGFLLTGLPACVAAALPLAAASFPKVKRDVGNEEKEK